MSKYQIHNLNTAMLELFAKALGMGKPLERSRYELEKHESLLAKDGGRAMDSTPTKPSSKEEAPTQEPQERQQIFSFRLECTCGSWGHECTEEEHDCPTECLIHIDMDSLGDKVR
jgi:hypothetical protein